MVIHRVCCELAMGLWGFVEAGNIFLSASLEVVCRHTEVHKGSIVYKIVMFSVCMLYWKMCVLGIIFSLKIRPSKVSLYRWKVPKCLQSWQNCLICVSISYD